jgi:hypothetical protein
MNNLTPIRSIPVLVGPTIIGGCSVNMTMIWIGGQQGDILGQLIGRMADIQTFPPAAYRLDFLLIGVREIASPQ